MNVRTMITVSRTRPVVVGTAGFELALDQKKSKYHRREENSQREPPCAFTSFINRGNGEQPEAQHDGEAQTQRLRDISERTHIRRQNAQQHALTSVLPRDDPTNKVRRGSAQQDD
jgi:hypothetical protein